MSVKKQRGQITILLAVSITLLMAMVAMVINVGMLVHAKINLQNSADLAAYAGAAVQARAMTKIGHLNYELRRNYKEFLYKYYVVGNVSLSQFPGLTNAASGGDDTPFNFRQSRGNPPSGIFPPRVCVIQKAEDQFCDFYTIAPLVPPNGIDGAIGDALRDFYEKSSDVKTKDLLKSNTRNGDLLRKWLLGFKALPSQINPSDPSHNFERLQPGGFRLGLTWANIMTAIRLENLSQLYFTKTPRDFTFTNMAEMKQLERSQNPGDEATALALGTIARNLSTVLQPAPGNTLKFQELLPTNAGSADGTQLGLSRLEIDIEPLYVEYSNFNAGGGAQGLTKYIASKFPIAYWREKPKDVFYGVVLTAQPKLLFDPWGNTVKLTATAVAKPFGAAIGPPVTPDWFITEIQAPAQSGLQTFRVPNLAISGDEDNVKTISGSGSNLGFFARGVLRNLCEYTNCNGDGLSSSGQAATFNALGLLARIQTAIHYSRSVDPIEVGKYLIPIDGGEATPPNDGTTLRLAKPFPEAGRLAPPIQQSPGTAPDGYLSTSFDLYREPVQGAGGRPGAGKPVWNSSGSEYRFYAPLNIPGQSKDLRQIMFDKLVPNGTTASVDAVRTLIEEFIQTITEQGLMDTVVISPPISYPPENGNLPSLHEKYKATRMVAGSKDPKLDPRFSITTWHDPTASPVGAGEVPDAEVVNRRSQYAVKLVRPELIPEIASKFNTLRRTNNISVGP